MWADEGPNSEVSEAKKARERERKRGREREEVDAEEWKVAQGMDTIGD